MSVAKQSPALEGNAWGYLRRTNLIIQQSSNPIIQHSFARNMIVPHRIPKGFRLKELARPVALGRQAYPGESYEKEPNPENGCTNIRAAPDDLPNNQPSTTLTTLPRFPRRPINHQLAKLSTTRRHTRKSIPFHSSLSCISWSIHSQLHPPPST